MADPAIAPDLTGWRAPALWLASGAVAGFGQVPFALSPLTLAGLAFAAWLAAAGNARRAARIGFACGTGYFAVTLHWIVEPFLIDVPRHGWMAPFALVLMAMGFALFWALAFWGARRIGGQGWRFALAFGVALAAVELARSYVLTGFPWALLGYVWSEVPAAQLAAWIGPFGLTLLTTLGAGAIATRARWTGAGLVALLIWFGLNGTGLLIRPDIAQVARDAPLIRLIQPNAPQGEKWDPDLSRGFFERQLTFTATRRDGIAPDLIVWPETAIPYAITRNHPALEAVARAAGGVPVTFGVQRWDGRYVFNTMMVMNADGDVTQQYDKHHLVPFGEYIPFGRLPRVLGLPGFAAQDGYGYSAGPGPRVLDLGGVLGRILPLICYEAIFPQDVAGAPTRPDWLLQITNDAWFGTFAGPQQHMAQARMRSIEQGLPMVRVANTGISAVIDAGGHVVASLALGQAGFLDQRLPTAGAPTVYARSGDLPIALLMGALLCGLALTARRKTAIELDAKTD